MNVAILTEEALLEAGGDVQKALDARRAEAAKILEETKSLPEWWETGVSLWKNRGRSSKFASPDAFIQHGLAYFWLCAERAVIPSFEGLLNHMGFPSTSHWYSFAKRNPTYREYHAQLMQWLRIPLEMLLATDGMERSVNGAWKRLTNIPDGWELDDDVSVVPLRYSWKDRKQQEVVGLDGATLEVVAGDKSAAELWREMQQAGKKLAVEDGAEG